MPWSDRDKRLGMDRPITRRQFFDGVAVAAGSVAAWHLTGGQAGAFTPTADAAYPPRSNGLDGQTENARLVMHAIRDETFAAGPATDTGETHGRSSGVSKRVQTSAFW